MVLDEVSELIEEEAVVKLLGQLVEDVTAKDNAL